MIQRITRKINKNQSHPLQNVRTHKNQPRSHSHLIYIFLPAKDLSHVPCKFYRVGSCTAGASCPFSHSTSVTAGGPGGGQKDTCAWFVKGNCKFGHKCALAHILPGQSMAMDRKNKKAAQVAAGALSGGNNRVKGNRPTKELVGGGGGNPLLSGSTAPTRSSASRMPMPSLKATISPSAPAPPLKDTEFASFGMDVDNETIAKLASAPALPQTPDLKSTSAEPSALEKEILKSKKVDEVSSQGGPTTPLPLSNPHLSSHTRARPSHDFGPIGSPPRSSPRTHANISLNGFSPGTSPSNQDYHFGLSGTSPFSAPHTQTGFLGNPSSPPNTSDFKHRSGLAASLGATTHLGGGGTRGGPAGWSTDFGPVPSQVVSASVSNRPHFGGDVVVEDEDLEEFIPGSLSDLLSPSERSRRMSRTNSGQTARPVLSPHNSSGMNILQQAESNGNRHHYSRSVPAPSLLGDIKSIWRNESPQPPANNSSFGLGAGTPSSFNKSSNFGGRDVFGEPSPSQLPSNPNSFSNASAMLNPTNASAAFLGGLHQHYLNRGATGGMQRSVSGENRLHAHSNFSGAAGMNGNGSVLGGMALSPPRANAFGSRPTFSSAHEAQQQGITNPPLPSHLSLQDPSSSGGYSNLSLNGMSNNPRAAQAIPPSDQYQPHPAAALSPSSRALQSHAPGQSLPQGLAAGYSRIHALPPPPNVPSPAFSGVGSPGSPGNNLEWLGLGPKNDQSQQQQQSNTTNGLESMFSRLSYSAAAARPSALSSANPDAPMNNTTVTLRTPSGGKPWQTTTAAGGPLSPLSGPVVTGDDDDLFSMDG